MTSLGVKGITALMLPKEVWHMNNMGAMRVDETDGLPPKIEAPHISLLDSFSATDRFAQVSTLFQEVAAEIEPFQVRLDTLHSFQHRQSRGYTLYVVPEVEFGHSNEDPLLLLQRKLYTKLKDNGVSFLEFKMLPDKYKPHVSLGKVGTKEKLDQMLRHFAKTWQPIVFTVQEICLCSKLVHDTVVRTVVPLGKHALLGGSLLQIVPFPTGEEYSININWIPAGTTDAELLKVFCSYGGIKAQVVFKTIEKKSYTKGWGHVTFKSRQDRDNALQGRFQIRQSRLEIFPCD